MAFRGWPAEAIEFYEGLEADNTRAYWQDHKKEYEELVGIAAELHKAKIDVTGHDTLKTAPKGYPKDHPRIDLLRHKGLIAWKQWPVAAWMGTAKAKQRVVDFFVAARPLIHWLDTNVGPSATPPH